MKVSLKISWIAAYFFIGVISSHSVNSVLKATISTSEGSRIYDDQIAGWLENIIGPIPKGLVVLTECYGGNAVDNFTGGNTAVASATSPGEQAEYGAYDSAAAGALKPGAGRTAQDVHNAGTTNKADDGTENPSKGGGLSLGDFQLDDTSDAGNVQSRHIVIYAGKPSGRGEDDKLRDKIKGNFTGQKNTTVKTAGGAGTSQGWDNPGTAKGLRDAIIDVGIAIANSPDPSKEQFIIFITDHGDLHNVTSVNERVYDGGCITVTNFPTFTSDDLSPRAIETPGFSAFIPFTGGQMHPVAGDNQLFFQQGQWIFELATNAQFANPLILTNFTELNNEFNDNILGNLPGEGVILFFPIDRTVFTNSLFDIITNMKLLNFSGTDYTVETLSQDSGPVPKRTSAVEGDIDGDRLADPYWPVKSNIPGMWTFWLSSGGYLPWGPYVMSVPGGEPCRVADFDGDGLADPVMVANGGWTFFLSSGGYLPWGPYIFAVPGGVPVAGDFDGDRLADPAMVANGAWMLWLSSGGYLPWGPYIFAVPGKDVTPLAGDFDGDRLADPVMVANGGWTLFLSSGGYLPWGPYIFTVPGKDVMPMVGDFDGDGLADPVMVVNNNWTMWLSSGGYLPWGPYLFRP